MSRAEYHPALQGSCSGLHGSFPGLWGLGVDQWFITASRQ